MFGDLLTIRIKAAEKALRDGRWDEAFRLAGASDLRVLPRAAAVLAALASTFLTRARDHFRDERMTEAQADLDRANSCCGAGPLAGEIAELHGHMQAVASELDRKERAKRGTLDEARRRVEAGSLVGGNRVLADAGSDAEAAQLREQIARRGADAAHAARDAVEMMAAGQWGLAAERIRRAKSLDPHEASVVRVEAALCRAVLDRAGQALRQGKISRAVDELGCADGLGDSLPEKRELARLVQLAKDAARAVGAGHYANARKAASLLAHDLGATAWLTDLLRQLQGVEEIQMALRGGPMGFAADATPSGRNGGGNRGAVIRVSAETIAAPQRTHGQHSVTDRLLLIVDGGGSYLVLRGGMAGIGRAACDHPTDVALLSDIGERHATISRMEEDYFLLAARDVEVGGQMTRHRLLRDGDRLVLGRKAKMTFHLPSRCSATAVLALSDTTKMQQDVRRVVLLNGHATIGNGPTSHIQCRHATGQLVLFERAGQLWLRNRNDGHADTQAQLLRLGAPVELGGVRVVLSPWQAKKLTIDD